MDTAETPIDALLRQPCWMIDVLPAQVPAESPGQFFAVEEYYLESNRLAEIKRRHIGLILKLNCYRSLSLDDETAVNPAPARIAEAMLTRQVYLRTGDALILSEPDALHLTLWHPEPALLDLIRTLAAGEGLFVWQPPRTDI